MGVRRETLVQLGRLRRIVHDLVAATDDELTVAWTRAWQVALSEWEACAVALAAQRVDGRWPSAGVIAREERAQRALAVTRLLLSELSATVQRQVLPAAEKALHATLDNRPELIGSQMPPSQAASVVGGLSRVDPLQVEAIVRRITQQITALTLPMSAEGTAAIQTQLLRGVQQGLNAREAARAMVKEAGDAFNGGLTRALVVSRTEILDAHRSGGTAWDRMNTSVVTGWQWVAQLDKLTCPSCWAQHGSKHSVDENGPDDHQQGRCARLPLTKSWRELGFNIPEAPSVVRDGQTVFNGLPQADQLAVMGPARLQLLQRGDVRWDQLSTARQTQGWRRSFAPTAVRDLEAGVA